MPTFRLSSVGSILGALALFAGPLWAQTVQPFFAPAQPTGVITVKLHPMENVAPGSPRLVTFGVPFTRGSMTTAGLSTVRVLSGGVEVPAHVEAQTPWRHLTNAALDGQSVRVARVQIQHTFSATFPNFESITVEWGGVARALDVPTLTDPLMGWHTVTSGTFAAADSISEPDVYALLPKSVLTQGVLTLRRAEPFADSISPTRDDPNAMDAIEHWPGYEEADRAFKNNFFTSINEDDPQVATYGDGQLNPYKTDDEPWLYDRSSTFFHLYLKTGFLRPLREAVRSTQFYRSKLFGAGVLPAASAGIFRLKQPNPAGVTGGNDAMYSYAECFAYDHWLTGDPQCIEPVRWVVAAHNAYSEPSHWAPGLGTWTERHTAFATLANLVAFELTGELSFRQAVLTQTADFIWHQNGAGGQLPANRLDGGLYHYGAQHGDGEFTVLIASPWMTSLTVDAMARAYGVSEDPAIAGFVVRAARFQAAATHFDENHSFDTAGAALRYPHYLTRFDGAPDALDGYDDTAINHALEVAATVAWGAYFQHLLNGTPDAGIEAAARELYTAFDAGVNHWIRPAAPPLGFTAFRVTPWRKYAWEHRTAPGLSWVMNQIDTISPPPTVAITAPANLARFTAPANILIQATATSPNATITKVEFFAGSTLLGEDTTAPYSFQWNGVIANLTGYTLTAKATTSLGVVGVSPGVSIEVVSPTHPVLTITNPAEGANFTAPATVTLTATAVPEGASSIARVVFMSQGIPLFEDTTAPYEFTEPNLLAGEYEYEIRVFDSNGGYDLDFVNFTVTTPTPPNVVLTAPAAGTQTAGGAVLHMSATASAPGSNITRVVFRVDDVPVGEDTTAPYEYHFNVPQNWPPGTHTITARAFETNGGYDSDSTTIEMLALAPLAVAFDSPAAGAEFNVGATVEMQASVVAPGTTVTRVEFFANGQPIGTDTTAPFTASFEPDARQWGLTARAFDSLNRQTETTRTIYVTGAAYPTVALTAPADGSILVQPATATLTANASVAGGSITRVQFYDGGTLLGEDTTAPYSLTTAPLSLGDHSFRAIATATSGLTADSQNATVTVGAANSPVVQITAPRFPEPQVGTFTQIRFVASAAHTGGGSIQRVEFWLDNALLATDTTAPYEHDWPAVYGYHELRARAYDTAGVQAISSTVAFELILPPTIALTSPLPPSPVRPLVTTSVAAAVTPGNHSITEVRFFVNGTLLGSDATAPYAISWTPPAPGNYTLDAQVFDARGLDRSSTPVTVTTSYSARQAWRFAHFGTYANSGFAADSFDANDDGEMNLMEFATNQNPHSATNSMPSLHRNGVSLEFTWTRSLAALADGVTFTVEWRDDLASGVWNNAGVSEQILSDNGTVQNVRTTLPAGTVQRFVRLRVSAE